MTFCRATHIRALSADPALLARRNASVRRALTIQWTPEMDAALVELSNARFRIIPIARRIGVSKSVARRRRDQLGLPKGKAPGPKPRLNNLTNVME